MLRLNGDFALCKPFSNCCKGIRFFTIEIREKNSRSCINCKALTLKKALEGALRVRAIQTQFPVFYAKIHVTKYCLCGFDWGEGRKRKDEEWIG